MAQHISIRVPWHDSGYAGNVCKNPKRNISCRCLRNIASKKNDDSEQRLAGCPMAGREGDLPCVGEAYDSRTKSRFLVYPNDEGHLKKLDDWQILTPIYGLGHGTANINHFIHERFRDTSLTSFGSEGIAYGDRIIKLTLYGKHDIVEGMNLIVTQDDPSGPVDPQAIQAVIDRHLL